MNLCLIAPRINLMIVIEFLKMFIDEDALSASNFGFDMMIFRCFRI